MDMRPAAEFDYEAGKNKLASIKLPSKARHRSSIITPGNNSTYNDYEDPQEAGNSGHFGKLLRLSGRVNLESRLTVGCCGAVLTYLSRRKAVQFLPGDTASNMVFRVSNIEMFSLKNTM